MSAALRILVVRRDNIGDLVCTTPLFTALRQHHPTALICALVNSYNAPVLAQHPNVDRVFVYTKLKHRNPGQSRLNLLWQRLRMHQQLKKIAFDYVLLPNDQPRLLRFARSLHPGHIIALGHADSTQLGSANITLLPAIVEGVEHEAQATYRLLEPLGIHGMPPPCLVIPDPVEVAKAQNQLTALDGAGPIIALHISARKPSQRWPVERYIELMRMLHASAQSRFILLWAPGSAANPLHPGDDEKAKAILQKVEDLPVLPIATHTLPELLGALAVCDTLICSDGGAMHLAAALGKPIVCLFGKSDAWRWHPWAAPYQLLQTAALDVGDISAAQVANAYVRLRQSGVSIV